MEVEKMATQLSHIQLQYSHTIGRHDQLGHSFREPVALARGQGDLIYVVNRADEYRLDCVRISVCTIGEEYLIDFGQGALSLTEQLPRLDGALVWPSAIALDSQWNVYVADEWLNCVFIFTKEGDYLSEWGTAGHGEGEISGPSGWPSIRTTTCTWWILATIGFKSSPRMAPSCWPGAARVTPLGSSTSPGA